MSLTKESLLQEKKDHIIAKLDNLTASQKRILIDHLNQFPHKEKMIDWNNKNLKWEDFAELLATTSKTQKLQQVKRSGLGGLHEGKDYILIYEMWPIVVVAPLSWEASKLLASKYVGDCEGEWCTAFQKEDTSWEAYMSPYGAMLLYAIDFEAKDKVALLKEGSYPISIKVPAMWGSAYSREDEDISISTFLRFVARSRPEDPEKALNIVTQIIYEALIKYSTTIKPKAMRGFWAGGEWTEGILNVKKEGLIWDGGTFAGGIWEDGEWKNGIWKDGVWGYGLWLAGYWMAGTWIRGVWKGGTHVKGTWKDGTWKDGIWKNGVWEDGIWEKGRWIEGVWLDGEWKGGVWKSGVWKGGVFRGGVWSGGTWEGGTWKGGTWEGGTWEGGTWEGGYIVDPETKKSVYSRSNPAEYWKDLT